jgi:hypothetical protein
MVGMANRMIHARPRRISSDGLLAVREPQGPRHATAIRRVVDALQRAVGDAWRIDSQLPIALDEDSELEPDARQDRNAVPARDGAGAHRARLTDRGR